MSKLEGGQLIFTRAQPIPTPAANAILPCNETSLLSRLQYRDRNFYSIIRDGDSDLSFSSLAVGSITESVLLYEKVFDACNGTGSTSFSCGSLLELYIPPNHGL